MRQQDSSRRNAALYVQSTATLSSAPPVMYTVQPLLLQHGFESSPCQARAAGPRFTVVACALRSHIIADFCRRVADAAGLKGCRASLSVMVDAAVHERQPHQDVAQTNMKIAVWSLF